MAGNPPLHPLRVLADTNVLLDQLLEREPWFTEAQPFWQARDTAQVIVYVLASSITDIFYISRKQVGKDLAGAAVARCLREFGLITVDRDLLEAAFALPGSDFEDNVQIACAQVAQLDLIVTRNIADFTHSTVPAVEPAGVVGHLGQPWIFLL